MVNLFEPRTMLKLVTRMSNHKTYLKDTFFKNPITFPTASVDVDFKKGNRKLAPFVHEKIGGKIVENSGYQTETFKPPLVAPNKITTALEMQNRAPGEGLYSAKTPQERAGEKLVNDLAELEEMIARREEFMCAQALFTGQIEVKGEGIDRIIDFGFTNKETLSGTDLWSDPASDPIADLKRYKRQVQEKGFVNPDIVIMDSGVVDTFINHEKVQKLMNIRNIYAGEVKLAKELPNGVSYVASLPSIGVEVFEYNEFYLDDFTDPQNPVVKPLVPEGNVAMLSSSAQYSMAYAAVTVAEDDALVTYEATRVPQQWVAKNPARQFVQINSKPLPIPHEVDSWYVAKVL
ncbi:MAG: major capsid protein [Paenisporosarcina sp.]